MLTSKLSGALEVRWKAVTSFFKRSNAGIERKEEGLKKQETEESILKLVQN